MHRSRVLFGAALLGVGALVLVAGVLVNTPHPRTVVVQFATPWGFVPPTLTAATATVHWRGGGVSTEAYLVKGQYSLCGPTFGGGDTLVASGHGSSGVFSATVDPQAQYLLYACNGSSPATIPFTLAISGGLTVVEAAGIALLGVGAVVLVLGVREPVASSDEAERILGPRTPPPPST